MDENSSIAAAIRELTEAVKAHTEAIGLATDYLVEKLENMTVALIDRDYSVLDTEEEQAEDQVRRTNHPLRS